MRKKPILISLLFVVTVCFLFYFYSFTSTNADNLYLYVTDGDDSGWEIAMLDNGVSTTISPGDATTTDKTVVLKRTATKDWASYARINVDSSRAVCVFVDDVLVHSNYNTPLTKPGEIELMQKPAEEMPFWSIFSNNPAWEGKTVTLVTRRYENADSATISFNLVSDKVQDLQQEAWANSKALPGGMFGLLALLLFALFIFQLFTEKGGYPTLLLSLSALLQMFIAMSQLHENPFSWIDVDIATTIYYILPLLFLGLKLTKTKKIYFISIISVWIIYFITYMAIYVFHLPHFHFMEKADVLCVALVGILLTCCFIELKSNEFSKNFLTLLAEFCAGYVGIYIITAVLNPILHQYIQILFLEAQNLYFRPLMFWVFTTILFALFILAVWEVLQSRIHSIKEISEFKLYNSLMTQSLQNAEAVNEALAVMRHDEIHHLRMLAKYISEDTQKAQEYANSLTKNLEQIPIMRFSQNRLINSILSAQAVKANQCNVALNVKAKIMDNLPLPAQEVTTVLMNLIDNAIMAANKANATDTQPYVNVILDQDDEMLYIKISNSTPANFDKQNLYNTVFGTNKSQLEVHGWGIRSAKKIVGEYGGELLYTVGEDITVSTVMQFPAIVV